MSETETVKVHKVVLMAVQSRPLTTEDHERLNAAAKRFDARRTLGLGPDTHWSELRHLLVDAPEAQQAWQAALCRALRLPPSARTRVVGERVYYIVGGRA